MTLLEVSSQYQDRSRLSCSLLISNVNPKHDDVKLLCHLRKKERIREHEDEQNERVGGGRQGGILHEVQCLFMFFIFFIFPLLFLSCSTKNAHGPAKRAINFLTPENFWESQAHFRQLASELKLVKSVKENKGPDPVKEKKWPSTCVRAHIHKHQSNVGPRVAREGG